MPFDTPRTPCELVELPCGQVGGGTIAGSEAVKEQTQDAGVAAPPARRWPRWHPAASAALLLVVYICLSFVADPNGGITSDTTPKAATLEAMESGSMWSPDVGYWAAAEDPDGVLHPLWDTNRFGDDWVNVTTLPMLLAASPLWDVGGHRLALLLPMLGGVACALAARALARRLGSVSPDTAFWVVGLASPVVVYALDLWEHAPGLALMLWGIVALLDASRERRLVPAVLAGVAFGIAFSMRTEAIVYGFVATLVLLVYPAVRRVAWRDAFTSGACVLAGLIAAFLANDFLERVVLGDPLRADRTANTAGGTATDLGDRLHAAAITTIAPGSSGGTSTFVWGALVAGLISVAAFGLQRGWHRRVVHELLAIATVFALIRLVAGVAWVSGFMVAFPLAAVGIAVGWKDPRARALSAVAVLTLPVIWLTQYTGAPGAQWGGRYLLTSSILLGVVGLVVISSLDQVFTRVMIGLCVALTALGVLTVQVRTHDSAQTGELLAAADEDIVISRTAMLFRIAAGSYTDTRPWLTADDDEKLAEALRIADARGAETLLIVTYRPEDAAPELPGWKVVESGTRGDREFFATSYERI